MSKGQAMRISAYLRTGVVGDGYLPLDGVLHAALMAQTFGAQEVTIPGDMAQFGGEHGSLPLRRIAAAGWWFYACSFADWGESWVDDRGFWVKRFDHAVSDLIDFGERRPTVLTASGPYKGYNMPIYLRHGYVVRWYAVGGIERVRDLLAQVTHLGKKTAQGWGRVNRWEVEPWAHDWSTWQGERLMRAIPAPSGIYYGVRPPYWRAGNQTTCALPSLVSP